MPENQQAQNRNQIRASVSRINQLTMDCVTHLEDRQIVWPEEWVESENVVPEELNTINRTLEILIKAYMLLPPHVKQMLFKTASQYPEPVKIDLGGV